MKTRKRERQLILKMSTFQMRKKVRILIKLQKTEQSLQRKTRDLTLLRDRRLKFQRKMVALKNLKSVQIVCLIVILHNLTLLLKYTETPKLFTKLIFLQSAESKKKARRRMSSKSNLKELKASQQLKNMLLRFLRTLDEFMTLKTFLSLVCLAKKVSNF